MCKYGIDPLYLDDVATVRFPSWDFAVLTTDPNTVFTASRSGATTETATWSIRFFDSFGEDWITPPIVAGATCDDVIFALESLPGNVIPKGLTTCVLTTRIDTANDNDWYQNIPKGSVRGVKGYNIYYNISIWEAVTPLNQGDDSIYNEISLRPGSADHQSYGASNLNGYIYRLRFFGNPGNLKQPEIDLHTDYSAFPTLVSPGYKTLVKVWTDGQRGEYDDYFADHCDGVTVQIGHYINPDAAIAGLGQDIWLEGMTVAEKKKLKACLGSSDFDTSNNVDVMNWDYGSVYYPHIVKLVRTVTSYIDGDILLSFIILMMGMRLIPVDPRVCFGCYIHGDALMP